MTSTLGTIELTIVSMRPHVARRRSHIEYERRPTRTVSVARGLVTYDVEAIVRDEDDYTSFMNLWLNETEAVFVDDQRDGRYSGTYILGDCDFDDRTKASTNIHLIFTLDSKGALAEGGIGFNAIADEVIGG